MWMVCFPNTKPLLAASALLALSLSPATAQDCENASDQATLNQCASASYAKADTELNAAYKQIMARLSDDADAKALLTKAQRAWIGFRDTECSFQASAVEGGSMAPMVYSGCLEDLTRTRQADFSSYLSCDEYDTSCPVPAED